MPTFFRKKLDELAGARRKKEPVYEAVEEERRFYVPLSVRPPDPQRFAPPVDESADDADDEDLRFLAALASEVDADAPPLPDRNRTNPGKYIVREVEADRDADLQLFRQTQAAPDPPAVLQSVHIDDIDLVDLLEDLSTTAAALRQRRAA